MTIYPKRGELWLINLDPTLGSEIRKTRPAIIVSSDMAGKLPLKLVVPLTDWKDTFTANLWHVQINPSTGNGLSKISAADTLQLRSVDLQRFIRKLGILSPSDLQSIIIAIATVIEYGASAGDTGGIPGLE
jgi:mRNA interferase MazF